MISQLCVKQLAIHMFLTKDNLIMLIIHSEIIAGESITTNSDIDRGHLQGIAFSVKPVKLLFLKGAIRQYELI